MNDEVLQLLVNLAVMMCACDGEVHDDEESLLQEWMESKRVPRTIALKAQDDALKAARGKGLNVKKVCEQLNKMATVSQKYDAIELCLRLAQIDGTGTDEEMRFLMSVGRWLDLDYDKFRELRDKILPHDLHETIDVDSLLGLHDGMSLEEKRDHVKNEYGRWNRLSIHSDLKKRQRAKEMLEIISKKRSELSERR